MLFIFGSEDVFDLDIVLKFFFNFGYLMFGEFNSDMLGINSDGNSNYFIVYWFE